MADPLEVQIAEESCGRTGAMTEEGIEAKSEEINNCSLNLVCLRNSHEWMSTAPSPFAPTELTIIYNGVANVYAGISPQKAQAIMLIAAAAATATANAPNKFGPTTAAAGSSLLARSLSLQSSSSVPAGGMPQAQMVLSASSPVCKLQAELPMARRHSLQSFLEKRRNRLASKAPYDSPKPLDGI
ncbi:hypothetical protein Cni_G15245 [Canna indica]|uniref:Protein TIFY n=1 Tax=Canna indica TaxID=4628 RepID=A0AAQ3QEK9_9LILI|nr:hypothetical protein Cni_G15245 [Canna indica]